MCLVLLLLSGAVGMKISTYGSGVSTGRTNKFNRVTTQPKTKLKITIIKCFCISFAVNVHGLDSNDVKESMVICYCKAKIIWALTQVAQRSLGDVLSSNYSHCEFVRKLLLHLQFGHSEFSLTSSLHEKKSHQPCWEWNMNTSRWHSQAVGCITAWRTLVQWSLACPKWEHHWEHLDFLELSS